MSGFQDEPLAPGCYSELLFTPDENIPFLDSDGPGFGSSFSSSTSATPRMLCFGDYVNTTTSKKTGHGSGPSCTASAPVVESTSRAKITAHVLPSSNRKRNGSGFDWKQDPGVTVNAAGAPVGSRRNTKKSKSDDPIPSTVTTGHAKGGKKEKLGERITALQQLVSPFGKTDTASVLHEAFGYIKFLQDQVQVLCSPYLQIPPSSSTGLHKLVNGENVDDEIRKTDLRSQGLCLVPMELTLHVADSNGADLWSSAAMLHHGTSN